MVGLRTEYRSMLVHLEDRVLGLGRQAEALIPRAIRVLRRVGDDTRADVLAQDDRIDVETADIAEELFRVLATQAPVATDLRLILGLMHAVRSVERIGDYSVNIARLRDPDDDPAAGADETLDAQIVELASRAQQAVRVCLDAFGRRAPDGVDRAEQIEDPLDTLHEGLARRLLQHASSSPEATTWSMRMLLASRHLERIGDHAVLIADQGMFVATGSHRPPRPAR